MEEPLDFVRLSLGERVFIKMRVDREMTGVLQGFDQHMNMILSDVQETVTHRELDPQSGEEIIDTNVREIPMLFIRGDSVVLVSRQQN